MEPFTIQCSSCQSLLRIRNPKMIGQIVHCPKCNSMLEITEPQQIRVESHRGVIDSGAMTKEAFAPELEDEYRLAPSDSGSDSAGEPEVGAPLLAPPRVDASPSMDEAFYENPFNAPSLPDPTIKGAHTALPPGTIQQLSVRRTTKNRQVLMIAVLGSSGVLIAGLLFTAFMFWYTGDRAKPVVAKNQANDRTTPGPKLEPNSGAAPAPDSLADPLAAPSADSLSEFSTDPLKPSSEGTDSNGPKPVVGSEKPLGDKAAAGSKTGNDLANALTQAMAGDSNLNEQTTAPENGTGDKPPAIGKTASSTEPAESPATPVAAKAELPEQLKKFENILNRTIEPQMIVDEVIQKAPPTAEELGLQIGVDSRALPPVDVATQMELEMSGLVLPPATPFSAAVGTWVQVSGIPTGVDLDSFAAAGIDPLKTISLKESTTQSLSEIGKKLAESMSVKLIDFNNRFLVFQASEEVVREKLGSSIKVDDLLTDAEQEQWFVKSLDQLLPQAASTTTESVWKINEGELVIDPAKVDSLSWFWAVRLLESWRAASNLESKLTGLAQDKFITKFVDPEQLANLDKPMQFSRLERTAVAQLIVAMTSANKMHAWVDWAGTSQRGLGPGTIDVIVTYQRTLRQALRDLINKYGLVIAFEDEQSLLITTSQEYLAQPRLYVLPSDGKTAEQWMEELEPLTPSTVDAVQPVRAILTPDSRFVIVRCCRPRLRG